MYMLILFLWRYYLDLICLKKGGKMILGDPYKFSVFVKTIKEWNVDETFCNGILLFGVDGNIFPKQMLTATLNSEVILLKEKFENIPINIKIFNMKKEEAFNHIYNITFPEDVNIGNDYQFNITPLSFPEDDCYIFAVSNGIQVRILAAKLGYIKKTSRHLLKNINISEAFISVQEMEEMANSLKVE